MAKGLTVRGKLVLKENSLVESLTNRILSYDSTTGEVTDRPALSASGFVTSALTSAHILVGNGSNVATDVAVTGDVLISNAGVTSIASGVIVNADVNASAAISYSKLNLATSIQNSDISGSAAIAYSKLNLATSITNNDVAVAAAIARTKIASGTAYRILANTSGGVLSENAAITAQMAVVSDINGQLTASTTSAVQIGYLSTVTSDVQSQLDTIIAGNSANALTQSPTASENGFAITWDDTNSEWALTDPVIQGIPVGGSLGQFLGKNSGTDYDSSWLDLTVSDISDITALAADINLLTGLDAAGLTTAELSYLIGVTSDIQPQIDLKLSQTLPLNAIYVGNSSNIATPYAAGSNGQVLSISAGVPTWQTVVGTGSVTSVDASGGTTGLSFTGSPVTTTGTLTLTGTLVAVNGGTGFASYAVGDILQASTTTALAKLAAVSAGSFIRSGGVGTISAWSTVKLPDTMSALGLWVANSANTGVNLTATALQSVRVNAGGAAWEAYTGVDLTTAQSLTNKTLGSGTVFSAIPTINDGITFTFNPNGTVSGLNIGAHSSDPSALVNGDLFYNSTDNKYRGRKSGATVEFINTSNNGTAVELDSSPNLLTRKSYKLLIKDGVTGTSGNTDWGLFAGYEDAVITMTFTCSAITADGSQCKTDVIIAGFHKDGTANPVMTGFDRTHDQENGGSDLVITPSTNAVNIRISWTATTSHHLTIWADVVITEL